MSDGQSFRLDSDQRTHLLKMGLGASPSANDDLEPDEKRTDYLYQILIGTLPLAREVKTTLPDLITGQVQDLVSISGRPLGELIQDPQTDLTTLKGVKEHCKQQGAKSSPQEEQDAFMAVYFAAIACALVYYGERISQHSTKNLRHFFDTYANKTWVLAELKPLFEKGFMACHD